MAASPPPASSVPPPVDGGSPGTYPSGSRPRPALLTGPLGPAWPLWTVPAAVLAGLGVGEVLVVIIAGIGQAAGGSTLAHPSPAVTLLSDVAVDGSFVAAALALTWFVRRSRPATAEFGYRRTNAVRGAGLVLGSFVVYYVITLGYGALFGLHGKDKLPSELGVHHGTAALVGAALFVCVIAPVAEEFFFRGFLFGALSHWRLQVAGRPAGIVIAAVIVGLLFGLAHTGSASPQYLIPLGFLGFVLCLLRWRTGSLYPCMALHSLNNCLALGVNELHWHAGSIAALIVAALLVIAALTGPLAGGSIRAPAAESA